MLQVQYAATNSSGTFASLIGWIDFGTTLILSETSPSAKITNSIAGGYSISFDISICTQGNTPVTSQVVFSGAHTPVSNCVPFGNTAYVGIPGNVALYMVNTPTMNIETCTTLTLRNIVVKDSNDMPIQEYFIVAADNEITNQSPCTLPEIWSLTTNGSAWELVDQMPATNGTTTGAPRVSGIGTQTVIETGIVSCQENTSANVFLTQSPSQIIATANVDGSRAGFSFGIIIPKQKSERTLTSIRPSQINYVSPQQSATFTFPLKCGDRLVSISYNGVNYPLTVNPILIKGQLGTYLFYNDYVLYNGTSNTYNNSFDIFTLSFQRCTEFGIKIIVFASRTQCS